MPVIYKIRNVVNGHFYVGSTVSARVRFQTHRRQLRSGSHHCQPLQRAWDKYSEDAFKFEIVETISDGCDVLKIENRWLGEHHGMPHCYNVSRVAGAPMTGRVHSEETRSIISATQAGAQHRLGHANTAEHRGKISAAMKGKKKSPEHVEKIRTRMLGTAYAKGRIVTEEMREARYRPVIEITTGLEFKSAIFASDHFGMQRSNLIRAIRQGGPIKRGPNAGLHFQYLEKHALPESEE